MFMKVAPVHPTPYSTVARSPSMAFFLNIFIHIFFGVVLSSGLFGRGFSSSQTGKMISTEDLSVK